MATKIGKNMMWNNLGPIEIVELLKRSKDLNRHEKKQAIIEYMCALRGPDFKSRGAYHIKALVQGFLRGGDYAFGVCLYDFQVEVQHISTLNKIKLETYVDSLCTNNSLHYLDHCKGGLAAVSHLKTNPQILNIVITLGDLVMQIEKKQKSAIKKTLMSLCKLVLVIM